MPLICDEILLLADVSLDAVEFRYVLILSDAPLPVVSGSVLLMLAVFLKLDDLAGTGGGTCDDAVVFVVVSVIIRLSVTVVMVIVSTTYLFWFNCLDDDRILFEFDAPPALLLPSSFAYNLYILFDFDDSTWIYFWCFWFLFFRI